MRFRDLDRQAASSHLTRSSIAPDTRNSIREGELGLNWVMVYHHSMTLDQDDTLRQAVRDRFGSADWSFASAARGGGEFHPYPARYIPALPGQVIELLGVNSGTVLDPFCGSGTTLTAARVRGLSSIGVDINPIACLISRVRTSQWTEDDDTRWKEHLIGLHAATAKSHHVGGEFAEIPRLEHWFPRYAQVALAGAMRYVQRIPSDDPWHDRVAVAVSAATVRVSRQDSDTRYAAIEKGGDKLSVARALERSLGKLGRWLKSNTQTFAPATNSCVLNRDARDLEPIDDESIALACFSPPYPNAYEYWLYHKYRMYWLGFDAVAVREAEIGARPHYSKTNGLTESDFADQMAEVFFQLKRVLKTGSHAVVIVGDSVIGGRLVDNGTLITDVASAVGFVTDYAGIREIAIGRSSFNRAHSRGRRTEHVLALRSRP